MTLRVVDVGIPLHNGKKFIERAIMSISEQSDFINQVILVDDGSTDDSLSFATQLLTDTQITSINTVKRDQSKGISHTYNEIANLSTSPYILILDQDDYLLPNFFQSLRLDKWGNQLIRVGMWTSNSKAVQLTSFVFKLLPFTFTLPPWLPILGLLTTRSAVLYPRQLLVDFPFDLSHREGNDVYQLHMMRTVESLRMFPKAVVHYEIHPYSASSKKEFGAPPQQISYLYDVESWLRRQLSRWIR